MFTNMGHVITGKLACCLRNWARNCTAVSSRPSGFWRCWNREISGMQHFTTDKCQIYENITSEVLSQTLLYSWLCTRFSNNVRFVSLVAWRNSRFSKLCCYGLNSITSRIPFLLSFKNLLNDFSPGQLAFVESSRMSLSWMSKWVRNLQKDRRSNIKDKLFF